MNTTQELLAQVLAQPRQAELFLQMLRLEVEQQKVLNQNPQEVLNNPA